MLKAFKPEEVERLFKETVYDGQRVTYKTLVPEQTESVQDILVFDVNIEDREEVEEETNGDFDPDVASMRSKMAEPEEELEEETPTIPLFKTPREIIDDFRAFVRQAEEEAKSASDKTQGTSMDEGQEEETGDGEKSDDEGDDGAQGGKNDNPKTTVPEDDDDDMSLKSPE